MLYNDIVKTQYFLRTSVWHVRSHLFVYHSFTRTLHLKYYACLQSSMFVLC